MTPKTHSITAGIQENKGHKQHTWGIFILVPGSPTPTLRFLPRHSITQKKTKSTLQLKNQHHIH